MSDLAAAAAALGVPEAIVQRSAAARAVETGMTPDEVLTLWAGGGSAPASAPAAVEETPQPAAEPETATAPEPAAETPAQPETATAPAAAPVVTQGPARVPVLVGESDNPWLTLIGALGLFVALLLVGLVGPSLQTVNPGARTSHIAFTDSALRGRAIYGDAGCASCHTQMVRPVTADVGLGAVTLNDSNQILGTRRFGPDLSDVGSRITPTQLEAIVEGLGGHPASNLTSGDLTDLVAYLSESQTLQAEASDGESGS